MVAAVIGARVEADEGDGFVRVLEGDPIEQVRQRDAGHHANAHDRPQAIAARGQICIAMGQRIGAALDVADEPAEAVERAAQRGLVAVERAREGNQLLARNHGGLTALMMVKEKFYVDVINLLYEAEQTAGVGEGSCSTKHPPGAQVVTFLKPRAKGE